MRGTIFIAGRPASEVGAPRLELQSVRLVRLPRKIVWIDLRVFVASRLRSLEIGLNGWNEHLAPLSALTALTRLVLNRQV